MERRAWLKGAGSLLLAGMSVAAGSALAADEHEHHHHQPEAKYGNLIASTSDCEVKGQACLAHCLVLLGRGDKEMAECAQSVNQMLAVCGALLSLASQNSAYLPKLAKLAADVCKDCEQACRKHEKKHEECRACAEACAACAKQCKAIA